MTAISGRLLVDAVLGVERMSFKQRERLAEEIHAQQPNLLYSVLILQRYGASPEQQLLAYVFGKFSEHGLLGIETETEKMLMLAALNLVECIAQTAPRTTA
jgi:hypothetical protein